MKYVHITTDAGAACKFFQVIWNNLEEFENVLMPFSWHGRVLWDYWQDNVGQWI